VRSSLRVHISPVGFHVNRVTEPIIQERADKVYLMTHHSHDRAGKYMEKIIKVLRKEKLISIEKVTTDIWDLFECLKCYKAIMQREGRTAHIYINVSTGSKITSIAGTLACMIWKGTPYYAHINYDDAMKDPVDGLPDEKILSITQLPVYSINKPRTESLLILRALNNIKDGKMKKRNLIEYLENQGIIDSELSAAAKHSKLKVLLAPMTVSSLDNPLVEVEYGGRQSNVILTSQGESTLKIFGEDRLTSGSKEYLK
jgi:hypothetical protein